MIHRVLKLVRQFHNYTQSDLSEKLQISKSYLSELESGKKIASLEILNKYSVLFEIPVSSLVFFSESLGNPNSTSEKFRKVFTGKVLNIMEWISNKNDKTQIKI